ncbi:MAG: type II toxin-antitoxin system VapC family toxin, partial [Thermoproteales archaeon]|nr:type II toxin-antitoxin system VapC family toxin [Thermoproteales archaeon]
YLIDTSALYPLILKLREKFLVYADKMAVLDLTLYEVGNVLWKEYKRRKIKNLENITILFQEMLASLRRLTINDLGGVLRMAVEKDLTFYDAAYVYAAEKLNIKLITEDTQSCWRKVGMR